MEKIIQFYRSCYQIDLKAISLIDFYSAKVDYQIVLETADLLQGKLVQYPVSTIWAEKLSKHLATYSKEKELYCCSFFISGNIPFINEFFPYLIMKLL